jgi:hypothetical protein
VEPTPGGIEIRAKAATSYSCGTSRTAGGRRTGRRERHMHTKSGNAWQKALWKIVRNPTVKVVAAIVVVMLAAWVVVQTEAEHRGTAFPVFFGHK